MRLEEKYKSDYFYDKDLIHNIDDKQNSIFKYGCISRKGMGKKHTKYYNDAYYGCVYVISGTSVYIDKKTGKEYKVYPGCIMQRMPDTPHYHYLDKGCNWQEFYFCGGKLIFDALVNMNLISNEPVIYIGESEDIHQKLIEYASLLGEGHSYITENIVPEFTKLLIYLHNYRNNSKKDSFEINMAEILEQNINVGVSMREIADKCNMGYESMRKHFKELYGCSMEQYRIALRINKAKTMLLNENKTLKQVSLELGYRDVYFFNKQFKQQTGMSPAKYVLKQKTDFH